jgi:glucose/arabinose dehydrogenase
MKKLLVFMLIIAMMFALVACGETEKDDDGDKATAKPTATATATAEPTPTATPTPVPVEKINYKSISINLPDGFYKTESNGMMAFVKDGEVFGETSLNYMTVMSVGVPTTEAEKEIFKDKTKGKATYEQALVTNTGGLVTGLTSYDYIKVAGVDTIRAAYSIDLGTLKYDFVEYVLLLANDTVNVSIATTESKYVSVFENTVNSIEVK